MGEVLLLIYMPYTLLGNRERQKLNDVMHFIGDKKMIRDVCISMRKVLMMWKDAAKSKRQSMMIRHC